MALSQPVSAVVEAVLDADQPASEDGAGEDQPAPDDGAEPPG
jgi:hypothetical protein